MTHTRGTRDDRPRHTRRRVLILFALGIGSSPLFAQLPSAQPTQAPLTVAAATAGGAAAAEPSDQPPEAQPKPAPPPFTAGWRDGFFIQNDNGDFRLQIGLLVHADGRFAIEDENRTVTDTFLVRRARPYLRGRFAQRFEFYFNPDFAGGALVVQDAYLDTRFANAFRVRVGKAKTPFGLERLQSVSNLLFFERALPTALVPNRDVGVQVLGDIAGGTVSYLAGVLNGVPDGASADTDISDSKEVAGRVVLRPFAARPNSPVVGLGVALAGSSGRQSGAGALPAFRTPSAQQTFFSYVTGALADGVRHRYSPQAFYYYKRFGGFADYVRAEMPISRATVRDDIGHESWQVAGSYILTGEAASDGGVRPRANFDFGNGHWGALQVAARYHTLKVDERAFTLGLVTAGSSREAEAWTAGINWYLTPFFKYVFNFERTVFDGDADGPRKAENAVVFRTQLNF